MRRIIFCSCENLRHEHILPPFEESLQGPTFSGVHGDCRSEVWPSCAMHFKVFVTLSFSKEDLDLSDPELKSTAEGSVNKVFHPALTIVAEMCARANAIG